jgi:hypothetical protein
MNFIKKIADKNFDGLVHAQFQKFSRGEFRDRAVIKAKTSGGKYTINTTSEFANEMVRDMAQKLGSRKTQVSGAIVSTLDLKSRLKFKEVKQFQGVKRYLIEYDMSGDEIIDLLNEFPKNFFALTFKVDDNNSIKIKPKAPKSGKPGKENEDGPKADFCKLITNDASLGKSFVFEKEFKEALVNHVFFVEEIVIPQELKNEKDFSKVREMARRKGKIVRTANIDGNEIKSELPFEA